MNRSPGILILFLCLFSMMASGAEKTITLQEAIQLVLDRSPEVAVAEARAARAEEAVREVRSLNRPMAVMGSGLAYNNGFPLSIEGAAPSIFQVGVNQSVFSKKNKNLILEAEEGRRASRLEPEAARNELAAQTALIYAELHDGERLRSAWAARLEAAEKERQITETLLSAGKTRPLDLTLAKIAVANARQQLLVCEERVRLAEAELHELTGITEDTAIRTTEPHLDAQLLEQNGESLYTRTLETRSSIRQAEANVRAKEFHLEAVKGDYWPRLEVVSQYALFSKANNYEHFFNQFTRNNYLIGLSIQVPIFNGHRTAAELGQTRQDLAEARLQLQKTKSDLKLGIERSVSALRVARGAVDLARSEVTAADESSEVADTLFQAGRIDMKGLVEARSQKQEKDIAAIEAEHALFQKKVELLRVTGNAVF